LAKYIRLVDYMIIDAKLSLIETSVTNVLHTVKQDFSKGERIIVSDRFQTAPLYKIEVMFQGADLFFNPSKSEIQESIKAAISNGIQMVCQNDTMTNSQEFEIYMSSQDSDDKVLEDNNDLMSLAIGSDQLVVENEKIFYQVNKTFKRIEDFSDLYTGFVQLYNENVNLDIASFRQSDMEDFRTAIEKYIA
jgi:dynein heavy chain